MPRSHRTVVAFVLSALLCLPALADAAEFRFARSTGIRPIAILTAEEFELRFGADKELPRSDEAVIALARRLFKPHWVRRHQVAQPAARGEEECGEHQIGLVLASLSNPAISHAAREEVDTLYAESVPPLLRSYTSGKFKFFFTSSSSNSDHNVTLAQVQLLAIYLNSAWTRYVTTAGFREPKHWHWLGQPRIDVKVYYLGSDLAGQTSSYTNHIELNSRLAVRDTCRVRTIPAHELFHRVQYSYGYNSGTPNMRWIVEGTAAWSQRYVGRTVGDYMSRMNQGLANPDRNLITARSYDACHLWVFLQQRASAYSASPIRQVWQNYAGNGHNAKTALNSYTTSQFGADFRFDYFIAWWHRANLFKDFTNAAPDYEYSEDEQTYTSCTVTYGPLSHAPHLNGTIADNSTPAVTTSGSVAANGADYYEYTIGAGVTHLRVVADGQTGRSFTYIFARAKSNRWLTSFTRTGTDYTYNATMAAGDNDKLQVIVVGNSGGSYTLRVGP